ncbi:lytic murein transglycosylase [Planomonospora corallina]|uniref:Lytic murein transglycosylase n=1 Tax=Planomonospora corallina TaxID=1806052 RepID=A0ABV8IJF9_9ACTN
MFVVILVGLVALIAAAGAVVVAVRPAGLTTAAGQEPGGPPGAAPGPGLADLRELSPQAATGPTHPSGTASTHPPATGPAHPSSTAPATAAPSRPDRASGGSGLALTPPRLMVVSLSTLPERTRQDIAGLEHVRKAEAFDGGAVRISGVAVNLLAVDPERFRSWAPGAVAREQGVWDALARGELVADGSAVRRFGLVLGSHYQVDGGPRLRLAASARFGLTGVDGLVSRETGRRMGLLPGVALLVHGPAEATTGLATGARKLLGEGAQVVTVGTAGGPGDSGAREENRTGARAARRATVGRPGDYLELYRRAAEICPGLSWTVLAAIGQVESSHGRNNGPSSAGAQGPMQFMPATWKAYGVDGDGDGVADIWSPYDAVPSAANYLCANGAGQGGKKLEKAVWFYNHSWSYVRKVLGLADAYARAYP